MEKLRMAWGIIKYPFKRVYELFYRTAENEMLKSAARNRERQMMWSIMHEMSDVTNTAYTSSPLYKKL